MKKRSSAHVILGFNLRPSFHLFRKRALGAIGIVLHTEILVNLEQTLLARDGFQELRPPRISSEKPSARSFETPVR